jgi:predicted alternative tryptophan synthase beta-subunit
VVRYYYAKEEGLEGLATEMGAAQWGSALCFATQLFGLKVEVFIAPGGVVLSIMRLLVDAPPR